MKRKITFFASLLLLLGLAVTPDTGSAQRDCSGGGCYNRYLKCREARVGEDKNPSEFQEAVCLSEYDQCVADCNARGRKSGG